MQLTYRVMAGLAALGGLAGLACFGYALSDLRPWELGPLWRLLGLRGVIFTLVVAGGLALFTALSARISLRWPPLRPTSMNIAAGLLALWLVAIAWLGDWVFREQPLTVAWQESSVNEADLAAATAAAVDRHTGDGSLPALAELWPDMAPERVAVMLARISLNRPSVFGDLAIGPIIAEAAARYEVSPVLLLHWCYIDSFYGEAPAGRMPFFREVNGELFRDLVQAHLPWWFVESPVRVALIEGPFFERVAPSGVAFKLRYALQKATYDIAIAPYMNSVMSDLFLVLREYPDEFPELFGAAGTGDPLAKAFLALRDDGLLEPYHEPFVHPRRTPEYYQRHRHDLIDFGRAAVYRMLDDFAFATKTQALVARYYADQYRQRLGPERWDALTERQQTSLLAMLRDVYTPSVGRLAYNLYMVPEFNTTPIEFMAAEAARQFDQVADPARIWIPEDRARLWGATGLMLRVLGETWGSVSGEPLAGFPPTATLEAATRVLARQR